MDSERKNLNRLYYTIKGPVAQSVARSAVNRKVRGSNPLGTAK